MLRAINYSYFEADATVVISYSCDRNNYPDITRVARATHREVKQRGCLEVEKTPFCEAIL